ncbi:BTAD domain-containing putative transcriptional regulator [Microbacterium sp.]|uniref:BTAD domain-containing putative transcriptional regulator n=1 Tax=Microbacterium sp. TaxID=51671 RepID=UPI0039E424FB
MRFRDLGVLTISAGRSDRTPGGRRPASVLAALLVELNQTVPTARLIERVWGGHPPYRAPAVIESHVWRLRQVLEPARPAHTPPTVLITDSGGYRLAVDPDDVDSRRLAAAVAQARTDLAAGRAQPALDGADAAAALWRGTPYADVVEEWIEPVRDRLAELWLSLREARVAALLETGRAEQALAEVTPLIAEQPYREQLRAQQMVALYRCGRQSEALDAYRQARIVLHDELGVEPGPQLRETEHRVLTHDPALTLPAPPVATVMPLRLSSFVGRATELADVQARLSAHRLVSIVGAMGCGKTRLAIEAAARSTFPDGMCFVELAPVGTPEVTAVASAVASALRLAARPVAALDTVAAYVAERRMLLVLDNCEHLSESVAAAVEALLAAAPGLVVLTTSREPLDVDGEQIVRIGPWPPPSPELSSVLSNPGAQLFADRVRVFDPEFAVDASTAAAVARICTALDGIALGIELAAARLRAFTLDDTADMLSDRPAGLGRSGRGPARHRTLADAVAWSHRLLRDDEQVLYRRLGVFHGTFSAAAASAVCGAPPLRVELVPDLLASLVHRSLLAPVPPAVPGGSTRFVQLVPVRAHAAGELAASEEADAVHAARNAWSAALVSARPRIGLPAQDAWYDALESDRDQVRSLLRETLAPGVDPAELATGVAAVARLVSFWHNRSGMVEGLSWLSSAEERVADDREAAAVSGFERALLSAAHGAALGFNQRMTEAHPYIDAARAALADPAAVPEDLRPDAGQALAELAAAAWVGDDPGLAADLATEAAEVGAGDPDVVLAARAVAAAAAILDRSDGGADQAEVVLADATSAGNAFAAFFASMALGVESLFTGQPLAGLQRSEESLRHYLAMGGREAGDLWELRGNHHAPAGQFADAARCYGASAACSRRSGMPWPRHPHTTDLLALTRSRLDPAVFDRAWAEGQRSAVPLRGAE